MQTARLIHLPLAILTTLIISSKAALYIMYTKLSTIPGRHYVQVLLRSIIVLRYRQQNLLCPPHNQNALDPFACARSVTSSTMRNFLRYRL